MKQMSMMILSTSVVLTVSAKVHKFSPEFQAVYDAATTPEVQEAQRKGAEAKLIYKIVDDEGTRITNAMVCGQWQNDYPRKTWDETFTTDANGEFVAQGKVGGRFGFYVKIDGYYLSSTGVDFHWRQGVSPLVKDGKWQPYGEKQTLVVKRKKHPVEMKWYNWGIDGYQAPATNVWIGLDLEMGQWCKPHGNGKFEDVKVRFSGTVTDRSTWDTKTEVSFSSIPFAGFYLMTKDGYSDMKSCYSASTNDSSYAEREFLFASSGGKGISPHNQTANRLADEKYIVFRTRCTVDENGKLVSAHYGKICGELWGGKYKLMFRGNDNGIYFNPTPNDTNLEDVETINRLKLLGR